MISHPKGGPRRTGRFRTLRSRCFSLARWPPAHREIPVHVPCPGTQREVAPGAQGDSIVIYPARPPVHGGPLRVEPFGMLPNGSTFGWRYTSSLPRRLERFLTKNSVAQVPARWPPALKEDAVE